MTKMYCEKRLKTCNVNSPLVFLVILEESEVVTIMRAFVFPSVCLSLFHSSHSTQFPFCPLLNFSAGQVNGSLTLCQ